MAGTSRDARREETARKILVAAQDEFALHGFYGATIRGIAERAEVHASLVMQHYKTKAALFAAASELPPVDVGSPAEHLFDVLTTRMESLPPETRTLVRSMLTVPEAAASMRDYLDERVANLAGTLDGPDAEAEAVAVAVVIVSSILGLNIAKHFLELTAFDEVDNETVVRVATRLLSPADPKL